MSLGGEHSGRTSPIARSAGSALRSLGEFGLFSAGALTSLAGVGRYASELLRQAGVLILGSTVAVVFLNLVIGGECALYGDYFLRSAGASDYIGFVTSLCTGRILVPLFFGYIFAAKVGCGLVAEIGSMRINEELDAYAAAGVDPMRYVVATRLAGVMLFVIVVFPVAALATSIGAELTALYQLETVSKGGFEGAHWSLQGAGDYLFSFLTLFAITVAVTLVATSYGFRVRGGPVEVGVATSRSMVANLVLIHVIYAAAATAWFGINPDVPIGG